MNQYNYRHTDWNSPFIAQRADPYVLRHGGKWYFTASVPEYDRIALRCADTLEGLREAGEIVLWRAHESGDMSLHIWAPELHCLDGRWYIYFAASRKDDIWALRPWVLRCEGDDPMAGPWTECGILKRADGDVFSFTDFSLDMTIFEHSHRRYCVWAEKVSVGKKISNLYIAEMADPLTLKTPQMLLSAPTYPWERHEFWVNEGPAFIAHGDRVYLTYSASDTSPAYCMGLLWADADADLMDISSWHKLNHPVFTTDAEKGLFGPGHNTFFTDEAGEVCTAYHARPYDEIIGNPLYDPNRHCFVMRVPFVDGLPMFSLENQLFQR
ncbi:MAG: family 43 glycosylhydrolase [Clostridia bacterium]|nr:family 43 glycosylhydrolase [Clostridia bacterium]